MVISKEYSSPHFDNEIISVEFVVLHYTAQSLQGSLDIFLAPDSRPVSCHLLIDEKGQVYELVNCWDGSCKKAFHSGQSFFKDTEGKNWKGFNNFSLGIELVNLNGNIFKFSEAQYECLFKVLNHLKDIYPSLQKPERIVGHEHIAGFRGKKDPGFLFDWPRFFKAVYPDQSYPERNPILTKKQKETLAFLGNPANWNDKKARQISLLMEKKALPFWIKRMLIWIANQWF